MTPTATRPTNRQTVVRVRCSSPAGRSRFLGAEDLLEQAWDEHADPFTNAVFLTISRLRRKLGDPSLIETRPGVGYRITDPAETPW
jgi:DNA-binding winged helix-turn-helix (wHTH) protein